MDISALVVDDSGIMRKMVMKSLGETGLANFEFTEAEDGVEALKQFKPNKIDMIFVDWNMPRMNGFDFVKKIRATQKTHIPIVMITTEGTMGKVQQALDRAGVDCYIIKPFTTAILQKKLAPLFRKLQAEAQAAPQQKKKGGFFSNLASKLQ